MSETPLLPQGLRQPDVIDAFAAALESMMQPAKLLEMFIQLTNQQATFATLVDPQHIPQFEQEIHDITTLGRLCVVSCARLTNMLRSKCPEFPPHDKLPLVKMQLVTKKPEGLK